MNLRRRAIMGIKKSRLPKEYQEVEYLESTGRQYIITGFKPNGNTKVEIKYQTPSQGSVQQGIFGGRDNANGANSFLLFTGVKQNTLQADYYTGPSYTGSSLTSYTEDITGFNGRAENIIEMSNYLKINGNSISSVNKVEFQTNSKIYLFSVNSAGSPLLPMTGRIWYFKIYDGGELVGELIPCYRKSDHKPGMYDLVTKTFFTNANASATTDFIVGADVN